MRRVWLVGCAVGAVIAAALAGWFVVLPLIVVVSQAQRCGLPGEGGCPESPEAQASQKAAFEKARLAALGGPPPSNCGGQPAPVHDEVPGTIWDSTAPPRSIAIGKNPLWLKIPGMQLENGNAVLHLLNDQYSKTADGFPILVTWIMDAAFGGTINVRLADNLTGRDAKASPGKDMTVTGVLDPSNGRGPVSNGNTPPYLLFYGMPYFHSPGCYLAQASWHGDSWAVVFAVGS